MHFSRGLFPNRLQRLCTDRDRQRWGKFPASVILLQNLQFGFCRSYHAAGGCVIAPHITFFIGYCGEYYTFGLAFLTIAAMSVASAVSVAYLKNRK